MLQERGIFRPYLALACFCEKVLREQDGVLSLIRIVDRFNITGPTPEMGLQPLRFTIAISFKAGSMRGKAFIKVRPISPSGKDLPAIEFPMLFEGDDDRGIALVGDIHFPVDEEGTYWFDVYLMDELVTRMPLRVFYQQIALTTTRE